MMKNILEGLRIFYFCNMESLKYFYFGHRKIEFTIVLLHGVCVCVYMYRLYVIKQKVIWIFRSCEHNFVLRFWFLFWVAVNFLCANGEFYVVTIY